MRFLKKTLLSVTFLLGLSSLNAATIRYVQISTSSLTQQTGSFNVASGSASIVYVGNGSAALPSLSLTNSPTSGLYRVGSNILGFSTNGSKVFEIGTSSVTSLQQFFGTSATFSGVVLLPDGSVSAPAISFSADSDNGFRRSTTNTWESVVGGADVSTHSTISGVQSKGTTTNDDAATGWIGEYVSSIPVNAVNLVNNTFVNVATITLTGGDWDVSSLCRININGGTVTTVQTAISLFSGNTTTDHVAGSNLTIDSRTFGATDDLPPSIPTYRVSGSGSQNVYFKIRSNFSAGTPQFLGGRISARRVR